ncbi:MAG: DUF2818 family protein [Sulfuricella sp.]|nr:DUF2818 family protein [Sulfuricella sp.]
MTQAAILLALAFLAANLPFLTERRLFVLPTEGGKGLAWRLLELILLYFAVGGVAWLVERNLGPVQQQHWEFYATTVCLFLVFAYPGFTYRYLWRHHGA